MHARGLLLVSTLMKDPVITKVLVRCREQAVAPSLTGGTCSCGGKMSDMEEVVGFFCDQVRCLARQSSHHSCMHYGILLPTFGNAAPKSPTVAQCRAQAGIVPA